MVDKFTKYKLPEQDDMEGIEMSEVPNARNGHQETMSYGIPIEDSSSGEISTQVEEGQNPQDISDLLELPRKPTMVQCPHCLLTSQSIVKSTKSELILGWTIFLIKILILVACSILILLLCFLMVALNKDGGGGGHSNFDCFYCFLYGPSNNSDCDCCVACCDNSLCTLNKGRKTHVCSGCKEIIGYSAE
ncbi:hypothetical protein FGO68_gene15304 [Halteria grandinella]|uniref:LITAF domain-containing protein n=1 Tax=Halteria grandinella TaxID=5974 RepID=A0A8J8NMC3_HALGN|nr:hypothetical protein FGO68_gene15304 [Halteria grandinella]